MPQIFSRGDVVYQCDVCNRKARMPTNARGLEVIQRCTITNNCPGKLHRVILRKDINNTPAIPPNEVGIQNWIQRRVLFNYTQGIEATTWPIAHNLGAIPTLQVFVNKDTTDGVISVEITDYTITVVDPNNLTITFDSAYSGTAQCMTPASQNTTNPQIPPPIVPVTDIQISNTNILTIATIQGMGSVINVTVLFKDPIDGSIITCEYFSLSTTPISTSPWAGTSHVMIAGRMFDVRTFNITTPSTQTGIIPNGSQMVMQINGRNITNYRELLVLLGKSPYTAADKITDKYIDVATVNITQPEMFYTEGEVKCSNSLIKTTYPLIMAVE